MIIGLEFVIALTALIMLHMAISKIIPNKTNTDTLPLILAAFD